MSWPGYCDLCSVTNSNLYKIIQDCNQNCTEDVVIVLSQQVHSKFTSKLPRLDPVGQYALIVNFFSELFTTQERNFTWCHRKQSLLKLSSEKRSNLGHFEVTPCKISLLSSK